MEERTFCFFFLLFFFPNLFVSPPTWLLPGEGAFWQKRNCRAKRRDARGRSVIESKRLTGTTMRGILMCWGLSKGAWVISRTEQPGVSSPLCFYFILLMILTMACTTLQKICWNWSGRGYRVGYPNHLWESCNPSRVYNQRPRARVSWVLGSILAPS